MPEQHSTTAMGWLPAWADLQERPFESAGSGFSVGGGGEPSMWRPGRTRVRNS